MRVPHGKFGSLSVVRINTFPGRVSLGTAPATDGGHSTCVTLASSRASGTARHSPSSTASAPSGSIQQCPLGTLVTSSSSRRVTQSPSSATVDGDEDRDGERDVGGAAQHVPRSARPRVKPEFLLVSARGFSGPHNYSHARTGRRTENDEVSGRGPLAVRAARRHGRAPGGACLGGTARRGGG